MVPGSGSDPFRLATVACAATLLCLLWSAPAAAGNRYGDCGGVGQRACCAFPEFRLPSCDTGLTEYLGGPGAGQGPGGCSAGTCYTTTFPAQCGRKDQRACTIFEFIPSCQSGLVERLYAGTSYCRQIDADGYPTICGDAGERPCVVSEKLPSCKAGNFEYPVGVSCAALDADGYPAFCGSDGEPACDVVLQLQLGITSCKPGLVESPTIGGTCYLPDGLGYPVNCGDVDEPPCDLAVQLLLNVRACKGNRVVTIKDNPVRAVCEICPIGANLLCPLGGEGDFTRPTPAVWPASQAPQGPRTIFLVHGLGSSPGAAWRQRIGDLPAVLDDPAIGHKVYAVDYNADNDTPEPLKIYRLERLSEPDGQGDMARWDLAYTHTGGTLDGISLSVFQVAEQLAAAIQAMPTEPNITLVGHSLGGIMARHVVYRYYDELRQAGKRITEVVTLGSPHLGGGVGLTDIGSVPQEVLACQSAGIGLLSPDLRRAAHQACQLERWHLGREEVRTLFGVSIDNLDYPHIRWGTVASSGLGLSFSGLPALSLLDSDKVVATISAFGIIADVCFPHRTVEAPGLPGYSGFVPATRQINGEPALSALCYEPAEADNPHYDHVPELLRADSSPEDHSSLLVNRNAVCFAKSMVADGLVASDEDGDGRRYCVDNCPKVANPDQLDSDSDGYGNRCDADFNNNGVVDSQDGARLKATFGSNAFPERDLNGNGIVDSQDGAILKSMFGKAPGPSGTAY